MRAQTLRMNYALCFLNDVGGSRFMVGVRVFERIGASPPHDHPLPVAHLSPLSQRAHAVRRRADDYVIVYLKKGSHLSSSPWRGEFETAKQFARDGMVGRGADECQIRSDTVDGPLLWKERRNFSATFAGPFKH